MKKRKCAKVLSLDFDYFTKFQNNDSSALCSFPDPTEEFIQFSDIIWATHYADPAQEKDILSVGCNESELLGMEVFLQDQKHNVPVLMSVSHKDIYGFITERVEAGGDLEVVNFDYHHDDYRVSKELDCGNWVRYLRENYNLTYTWVCSENGWFSAAGTKPKEIEESRRYPGLFEFLKANPTFRPDLIFICRSDVWVPPHLDRYFGTLVETVANHFSNAKAQTKVVKPRDISESVSQIKNAQRKV